MSMLWSCWSVKRTLITGIFKTMKRKDITSELGNRTLKRIEKSPDNYTKRDRKLAQIGHWMGSISVLIMFSVMMYFCYTFTNIEM